MIDINVFFLHDELSLQYILVFCFKMFVYFIFDPNVDLFLSKYLNFIQDLELLHCVPLNTWIKK